MNNPAVFKLIRDTTLAEAVAEQIITTIATGQFQPGDRLPTEAELMQQFGVGRSTLREALKSLAIAGLIETRRSAGTFVSGSFTDFLSNRLNLAVIFGERELRDIVEVRYGLEGQTAALAAERATTAQKEKLAQLVSAIEEHLSDSTQAADADMAFHVAIAEASQNQLLLNLILSIRSLIYDYIKFGYTHQIRADGNNAEHQRILEAIQAGYPGEATQAMLSHLAASAEWMLAAAKERRLQK
jgi:GntR family transcriptional regulator, transcriptional repressor for pyruvate dehydrogenase complex